MDLGAILCGRAWGANPESDLVFDGKAESAAQDVADPLNLLQVMLAKGGIKMPRPPGLPPAIVSWFGTEPLIRRPRIPS